MKKSLSISLVGLSFIVVTSAFTSDITAKQTYEAESAQLVKGGSKVKADHVSHEAGAGMIKILIDGKTRATVDLSVNETRKAQQLVYSTKGLTSGKHVIKIIKRGSGPVSIDALIVGE